MQNEGALFPSASLFLWPQGGAKTGTRARTRAAEAGVGLSARPAAVQIEGMPGAKDVATAGHVSPAADKRGLASMDPGASNEADNTKKQKQVQTQCNSLFSLTLLV